MIYINEIPTLLKMMDLYDEYKIELKKLTRLVLRAQKSKHSIYLDESIIQQSCKVDLLIEKIINQNKVAESDIDYIKHV